MMSDESKKRKHEDDKVVLYSYWRSSSAWRVRIALNLKEIDYEYRAVSLIKGEQQSPDYLAINPLGRVPTLLIDGQTLTQSRAIIEYLDETRPNPSLLPRDQAARAQARAIADVIVADIQPLQNLQVLQKLQHDFGVSDEKKNEWAKHFNHAGLKAVETAVQKTAGRYCVGDSVTLADICLIPQLYSARRFGVDVSEFPTLLAVEKNLLSLPAFQRADAFAQPDAPPK
jgi:maleylacetoacetate isomerase